MESPDSNLYNKKRKLTQEDYLFMSEYLMRDDLEDYEREVHEAFSPPSSVAGNHDQTDDREEEAQRDDWRSYCMDEGTDESRDEPPWWELPADSKCLVVFSDSNMSHIVSPPSNKSSIGGLFRGEAEIQAEIDNLLRLVEKTNAQIEVLKLEIKSL
jgi:hypothetical protein